METKTSNQDLLFRAGPVMAAAIVAATVLSASTLLSYRVARAQAGTVAEFSAPRDGEILTGETRIRGTAFSEAFLSAEIALAYPEDPTSTWFVLFQFDQPVVDGELAAWDTNTVSDGSYRLRLRVSTLDGTFVDAFATIQIRNYTAPLQPTPAATPTAIPPLQIETAMVIMASPTAPVVVRPSPTPLPLNPAALTPSEILGGFSRGALAVIAAALIVVVVLLRRRRR